MKKIKESPIQRSVYIIKPEAQIHSPNEVSEILESHGLAIIERKWPKMTPKLVEEIYRGMDDQILQVMVTYLDDKVCEVGCVEGPKAIQALAEAIGTKEDPSKCFSLSLRFLHGANRPTMIGKKKFWLNAFDYAKNEREASRLMGIFCFEHAAVHTSIAS